MTSINPEKYLDLIAKYRTQVTSIVFGMIVVAVFFVGRSTVDCPPKEVVCKSEILTIKSLFKEIEKCQSECTSNLRIQRDESDSSCKLRIRSAIDKHRSTTSLVTCEEVKALMPQCKKRRKQKWRL